MSLCVVEGCGAEYDVTCSFSFYNVNTTSDSDELRQEWIEGALQEESECLWRHVSLQLCSYHFESDQQGLWIESPVLPELLSVHAEPDLNNEQVAVAPHGQVAKTVAPSNDKYSYQGSFESFLTDNRKDVIKLEHNYSAKGGCADGEEEGASRLNVRQLVDALGYLSFKNLQRKQLWVVNVEAGGTEASVTQTEQVIAKLPDPASKQIIEIIPPVSGAVLGELTGHGEVLEIMEETTIPDNFIYEIAEEQEIANEEVKEIPYVRPNREWTVNIVPEDSRPKYAFIKHCTTGKKRKHFVPIETQEVTFDGQTENLYILPDADPSVGIEITTSYEPDSYVVDPYQNLMLEERPRKRNKEPWEDDTPRRRKKKANVRDQIKKIKTQLEKREDWQFEGQYQEGQYQEGHYQEGQYQEGQYEEAQDVNLAGQLVAEHEAEVKKSNARSRRKNKKYANYDFVT